MYEMWGATGVTPWPHTWAEYRRIFTGWRRHRWEHTGQICVTVANGLLPRKDRRSWRLTDFCSLFKPPAKWKAIADGFKDAVCGAFGLNAPPSPDVPPDSPPET